MKSYAKIRKIYFSQTPMPSGNVDLACYIFVDTPEGVKPVRCDTEIRKSDTIKQMIQAITDQVEIGIAEARDL
jgi:hypothetical protein